VKSTTTGETRQLPAQPSPPAEPPAEPHQATWWVAALITATVATLWITWPLALHMTQLWSVKLPGSQQLAAPPPDAFAGTDALQTMHVNRVVIDDVLHLREPFLDPKSGVAGPGPLRTTSLDLPWTPVVALLLPLAGLVAAYNTTLLLSSVLTVLCAFGFLRRHTRFPLLALAGALLYAFVPGRVFQLSLHFNAVMWWAFPAAAWALEAMLERHGQGRRWLGPGAWLAAVILTVGLSGEYHHALYLSGMVGFLVVWWLVAARLRRRPVPVGPALLAIGSVAAADVYVLGSFKWVFGGGVAGENGQYAEALRYAPNGLLALVRKHPGELGEGLVYLGLPVALLALAGLVVALARRAGEAAYAVLLVPVLFLTFGPAADHALARALRAVGLPAADPYRRIFETVPFLQLQRVSARLLVLAALLLVLLAVIAVDAVARSALGSGQPAREAAPPPPDPAESAFEVEEPAPLPAPPPVRRRPSILAALGVLLLVVATVWTLNDYRILRTVLRPAYTDNQVVVALQAAGDRAGPFLGLPVYRQTYPWNAASTYLASQTGRRVLNAYNQSSTSWLNARADALAPLNDGRVDAGAVATLRATGTRQVVVINESHVYCCDKDWRAVVDQLVGSGQFRLVVEDTPFALLELRS
jgi:hypothetical protein